MPDHAAAAVDDPHGIACFRFDLAHVGSIDPRVPVTDAVLATFGDGYDGHLELSDMRERL